MMMINAEAKDNTFELEFLGYYFYPACMNEKCSFYTDLNNSIKGSKLLDCFSLSVGKHVWLLGRLLKQSNHMLNNITEMQISRPIQCVIISTTCINN